MNYPKVVDYLGTRIKVGDQAVYAATRGIRQGVVLEILEYPGDYETMYKVKMRLLFAGGVVMTQTFMYEPERFWIV